MWTLFPFDPLGDISKPVSWRSSGLYEAVNQGAVLVLSLEMHKENLSVQFA